MKCASQLENTTAIQESIVIRALIDCNAHFFRTSVQDLQPYRSANKDELIGKIGCNKEKTFLYEHLKNNFEIPFYSNKYFSYDEYMMYIDNYETLKVKYIINYRKNNPAKYMELIAELDNSVFLILKL